ncbi:SGNH hydrolase-type esterase domain-containing protein [Bisporella sp. PMI_857]|nr:SGNH hydrolase-type esterase domain-containing protein [Bisporella sp. PMI_857]
MHLPSLLTVAGFATMVLGALENKKFRIMPLGASITNGAGSKSGNGYRRVLWQQLNRAGKNNIIQYIGSQKSGNMIRKQNEGHPGFFIANMTTVSKESIKDRPNVILIFVGTNDMTRPVDPKGAPERMGKLVDHLFKEAPDATILVAGITTSRKKEWADRIDQFAKDLVPVIDSRAKSGKHIALVDMSKLLDTKTDFHDDNHPNDSGFKKISNSWFKAIKAADGKGWIKDPVNVPGKKPFPTVKNTSKTEKNSTSHKDNKTEDKSKTETKSSNGTSTTTEASKKTQEQIDKESKEKTEKTTTSGPNGFTSTNKSESSSKSDEEKKKEEANKTTTVGADGKKTTTENQSKSESDQEKEAKKSSENSFKKGPNGETISSSSSSSSSSESNESSSSSSSSTTTVGKRSAKFRLMDAEEE